MALTDYLPEVIEKSLLLTISIRYQEKDKENTRTEGLGRYCKRAPNSPSLLTRKCIGQG